MSRWCCAVFCAAAAALTPPARTTTTTLGEVVSTCIGAAEVGAAEVRRLRGAKAMALKEDGESKSVVTMADVAAQAAIVGALSREWPDLDVVGEEDQAMVPPPPPPREGAAAGLGRAAAPPECSTADLRVFVDPLDGTREFVQGRVENVYVLIGIVQGGRPVAGVVSRPFFDDDDDDSSVLWTSGDGLEGTTATSGPAILTTGDGDSGPVAAAKRWAKDRGWTTVVVGGTAAKLVDVVEGRAGLAVTHTKTMAWDTAATEALVVAAGGKVTDYFGAALTYDDYANSLGVVASGPGHGDAHDDLCRGLRSCDEALALVGLDGRRGPQAVDVARDLDDVVLTADAVSRALGRRITSFHAAEDDAVRGLMSTACRLRLDDGTSTFYKRVVFADLAYQRGKSKLKLDRDTTSYAVEAAFLSSRALDGLDVAVSRAYAADLRPTEAKFALYLRDFDPLDGWTQRGLVDDRREAILALEALAKFHAHFWGADNDEVWNVGAYFEPAKQDPGQLSSIATHWPRHHAALELPDDVEDLGDRLQAVAADVADLAHARPQTIVHGDPKAANFLFRPDEAALIDLQWTGHGRAANDVGHFLAAALDHQALGLRDGPGGTNRDDDRQDAETALLDAYFATLAPRLPPTAAAAYTRADFQTDVDTAILDAGRLVFAYQWTRLNIDLDVLASLADVPGRNAYNKNYQSALWLVDRCRAILDARGTTVAAS